MVVEVWERGGGGDDGGEAVVFVEPLDVLPHLMLASQVRWGVGFEEGVAEPRGVTAHRQPILERLPLLLRAVHALPQLLQRWPRDGSQPESDWVRRAVEGLLGKLALARGVPRDHNQLEPRVLPQVVVHELRALQVEGRVGRLGVHTHVPVGGLERAAHRDDVADCAGRQLLPPRVADEGRHVRQRRAQHDRDLVPALARVAQRGEGQLVAAARVELVLGREVRARVELVRVDLLPRPPAVRPLRHRNVVRAKRVEGALRQPRAVEAVAQVGDDGQVADQPGAAHGDRHHQRLLVVLVLAEVANHEHVRRHAVVLRARPLVVAQAAEPLARARPHRCGDEEMQQLAHLPSVDNA
mmetsp:Transcript_8636/g.21325  ORF Transcript_8636/g.21325 Transcript_8636/m.21325 type:complete len:354 (-) Transcript_8636:1368-2429(-)